MQEGWEYIKEENFQINPPTPQKKDQEKRLEQQEEGEREREQCVSLHKNIALGGSYNEPSIHLFFTTIHSLLV